MRRTLARGWPRVARDIEGWGAARRSSSVSFGAPVGGREPVPSYARPLVAAGVAAANFGPGLPSQAHQPREYVEVALLLGCHERLAYFLAYAP